MEDNTEPGQGRYLPSLLVRVDPVWQADKARLGITVRMRQEEGGMALFTSANGRALSLQGMMLQKTLWEIVAQYP